MATNYPGPYQLRVFYDTSPGAMGPLRHVMQFNISCDPEPEPGQDFDEIAVEKKVGGVAGLETVAHDLRDVMQPIMSDDDAVISHMELWKFDDLTFDASYVATHVINVAGTQVNPGLAAGLECYTFRTEEGGIMKIYNLEAPDSGFSRLGYLDLGAGQQDFVDYFLAAGSQHFLGRDTSYPIAFLRLSPSTSETTFKQRFRP